LSSVIIPKYYPKVGAKVTAQIPDTLLLRGKQYALCNTPLDEYLRRLRKSRRPDFRPTSSACWRGYTAFWEVRDDLLYLVDLEGLAAREDAFVDVRIGEALPWLAPPVPATWVTGELRCPEGRLVSYVHAGFASGYERDRLIWVEKGRVVEEWLRVNPPEAEWYRIGSDGGRTRVEHRGREARELEDPFAPDEPPRGYRFWGNPPPPDEDDEEDYVLGGEFRWWPPRR
jgi:hypothetical protein